MGNTTDDLLTSIKTRSMAPNSQRTFTDVRLLTLMTEELRSYVAPQIMSVREDYFLHFADQSIVANQTLYPLAERAMGSSLKALSYVDANSVERPVKRTDIKSSYRFSGSGNPTHFYMQGDAVRILPVPTTATGTLRQYYFRDQSELVKTSECAKITDISSDGSLTTFTVDTDLSGDWAGGDKLDLQSSVSPFMLWNFDATIDSITTTTIVFADAAVQDVAGNSRIAVGDYICPRFKTNIPQIPVSYHPLLAQRVVVKMYESLGDQRKYQLALVDLKQMEKDLFGLIKSRIEAQPRKVRNAGIFGAIGRF